MDQVLDLGTGTGHDAQATVPIDQEHARRMIDRVALGIGNAGVLDEEARRGPIDLHRRSRESTKPRIKAPDVSVQDLRGIALRVERHEQHLHPLIEGPQVLHDER